MSLPKLALFEKIESVGRIAENNFDEWVVWDDGMLNLQVLICFKTPSVGENARNNFNIYMA